MIYAKTAFGVMHIAAVTGIVHQCLRLQNIKLKIGYWRSWDIINKNYILSGEIMEYQKGLKEELEKAHMQKQLYNYVYIPKIVNGSSLSIGDKIAKTQLKADQHFNWFQKLMWKWCFGVKVEDYSEE